jgi:ribosome-associated protein
VASTRVKKGKKDGAGRRKTSAVRAPAKSRTAAAKAKPAKASEPSGSSRVALAIAEAALDKKALNVEIIDVQGKVDYADYVVVMSGTSDRQVNALARGIAEDVEKKTGSKCLGVEGLPGGAWVLMDFGDVVVHIFHHDVRGYYDLESLWIDAARLPVPGVPAS